MEVSVSDDKKLPDDDLPPELESGDEQEQSPRALARAERKAQMAADKADRKAEKVAKKEKKAQENADGTYKGPLKRMMLFFRQVVAELRKVIWPTRKELLSYTWVVLIFVLIMGAYIGVLDFIFTKGVLFVFG